VSRINFNALTQWITAAAQQNPERLDDVLAARLGVSRRTARRALVQLTELHWLVREGSARRPRYKPGLMRQVVRTYSLAGLEEDIPWELDFAPFFALPTGVNRMVHHAFSELLNNAIDHSGGSHATVSLRQTASHVQLLISDDGRGLFQRIAQTFSIESPQLAMLELSKGKLTTQPHRHTGQGLFFTSKLADVFDLHANEVAFQQRDWDGGGWHPQRALKRQGTSVYASFSLDTPRTLEAVRKAYSLDGFGVELDRTVVPLRVITSQSAGLESRAQARRVAMRLHEFRRAELDFDGVREIGHAFADELFRVLARETPRLELVALNMAPAVARLVDSVRATAAA
jgi:anti-sigma regulatory factor (Ser/Thr protein kinase)